MVLLHESCRGLDRPCITRDECVTRLIAETCVMSILFVKLDAESKPAVQPVFDVGLHLLTGMEGGAMLRVDLSRVRFEQGLFC